MNTPPATRDTPIGRIDFYAKIAPVQVAGTIPVAAPAG